MNTRGSGERSLAEKDAELEDLTRRLRESETHTAEAIEDFNRRLNESETCASAAVEELNTAQTTIANNRTLMEQLTAQATDAETCASNAETRAQQREEDLAKTESPITATAVASDFLLHGTDRTRSEPLKLPSFWTEVPDAWFQFVESSFEIKNITDDQAKFHHVVISLDKDI